MKLSGNTILITGGTSGIGLELARQLHRDNTVIVTGRDRGKLSHVGTSLAGAHCVQSDVSDPHAIASLYENVTREFPALNVLINNAGIMRKINLHDASADLVDMTREIDTNLSGPIRMVKQFLPHLKRQKSAAIVNVSSGLAFVPFPLSPVYSATKAGLHSFTQALRVQMRNTSVKVFELAPPGTETPLFRGDFTETDLGGMSGMDVVKMTRIAIRGLEKDVPEIRPGLSNMLKLLSRAAPGFALNMLGKAAAVSLERMREPDRARQKI
jgi:uncharacterized oxidoreductase